MSHSRWSSVALVNREMKLWSTAKHAVFRERLQNQQVMATASPFLSEDPFLCSICLDIFTEPVSTPCGHSFCKACITRHREGKEQSQCPLCNYEFDQDLKLCVNTNFRDVVEDFRKSQEIAANNSLVTPGQVPCDYCVTFAASKTCLVCLTSYCETHLEPHHRVPALQTHKLTDPVPNLEDKICQKHNRILEPFCRDDLTSVCVLCIEHTCHDTVPVEETYIDKRAQMAKPKAEVQEIKLKRGKKQKKRKGAAQTKKEDEVITHRVESNQIQTPHIRGFPNDPHDPHIYFYLPANMGMSSGKFYYEVETKGKTGWLLGIVRESTLRRRAFIPNPRNGQWIINMVNDTNCVALHHMPFEFFLPRKPERVLVFVDYSKGMVSFSDADTLTPIFSFTGCKFRGRIFLFYIPATVSCAEKLRHKIQKLKGKLNWPNIVLYIMLFFLILILS
ncbi:uncharacterized protein V6R79_011021 [Siganus canaliculatus]